MAKKAKARKACKKAAKGCISFAKALKKGKKHMLKKGFRWSKSKHCCPLKAKKAK